MHDYIPNFSARNNNRPLAIFWPISAFGWSKSILGQPNFLYVFTGTATSNLKTILFSNKNYPIFKQTADQFLILIFSTELCRIKMRLVNLCTQQNPLLKVTLRCTYTTNLNLCLHFLPLVSLIATSRPFKVIHSIAKTFFLLLRIMEKGLSWVLASYMVSVSQLWHVLCNN